MTAKQAPKKRGPGRPAKPADELYAHITIRVPPALLDRVDRYRSARMDDPTRAAMARELLAEAVAARDAKASELVT